MERPAAPGGNPLSRAQGLLAALLVTVLALATAPAVAMGDDRADGNGRAAVAALDPGLTTAGDALQSVIVQSVDGVTAAARALTGAGGAVDKELPYVGGVSGTVPAAGVDQVAATPGVTAVTKNRTGRFVDYAYDRLAVASGFAQSTEATTAWGAGNLGRGVGVAVLDTGISPMRDFAGRLVHGPDLSGEGTVVDTYGHGTVMAGAIGASGADSMGLRGGSFPGVAPGATLVSVKVAGRNGAVDVSTILEGMHWISAYREQFGIRVMNLSWGVPSTQDPAVDPLNYAVQRLWREGVVVVVAAGNSGPRAGTITKPGDDPVVLTVGAYNDRGTARYEDDSAVAWSSQGPTAQGLTKPDLVAPGRGLTLTRGFGSTIEADNPKALVPPSYIRGSGSSQAAAVTSGVVALLLAARPELTPDQVKHVLKSTALPLNGGSANAQGTGRLRLAPALTASPDPAAAQTPAGTGLGSIEASRGGYNVHAWCDDAERLITGEIDVRCEGWDPRPWVGSTWRGESWTGSTWRGAEWTGSTWRGLDWTSAEWNGSTWRGGTWTGSTWRNEAWTGSTWRGSTWRGSTWRGSTWRGSTWRGSTWRASSWSDSSVTSSRDGGGDGVTGSADGAPGELFLTAWWGQQPPWNKRFPGEVSEPAPELVTAQVSCTAAAKAQSDPSPRACS
jgi:serine protease AprX